MTASASGDDLSSAFQDAASKSWSVRAAAGRRLAAHAEVGDAARILDLLLLDGEDTAVTQETAEALLGRGDVLGLHLVLKALAVAADPDVPNWDASTMGDRRGRRVRPSVDDRRRPGRAPHAFACNIFKRGRRRFCGGAQVA